MMNIEFLGKESQATARLEECEIFIIPNSPSKVENMINGKYSTSMSKREARAMEELFTLNHWGEMPDDEKATEIWWTSPNCENIVDHHPRVLWDDNNEYFMTLDSPFLPLSIVKEWKEGETKKLFMPVTLFHRETDKKIETVFEVNITLSQTKYRYRTFGTWEECINKIA